MVFDKPFDKDRLTAVFNEMAKEAEFADDEIRLTFEAEVPHKEFPLKSGAMDPDYYVENEVFQNWFCSHVQLHLPDGTHKTGLYRGASVWLRIFNGTQGQPTVINIGLD